MESIAAPPREGLTTLDYLAVGGYLAVTLAIVVWSLRRQSTTEDFFLGGRRMPWMAVGLSLMATLMSTITYLGVPGEMIKHGVALFIGYLSVPFSMAVVLLLWVPFFMRLRLTSAYEYLECRFNYGARLLGGLLFLLLRLGWMSLVMYTASLALAEMTRSLISADAIDPVASWIAVGPTNLADNLPLLRDTLLFWVIGVVGLAATVYTAVGGIRAVIWTDVLQFLMLFGGTWLVLGYVFWTTGTGPTYWWSNVAAHVPRHTSPPLFSLDVTVRMTAVTAMLSMFFWTICTHGSDQVVLQRYFSTSSLGAARRSYVVNAVADVSVGALLALSGLALLSFYLEHPTYLPEGISPVASADKVLPYFFAHQLPAGLGGLILASFLCDAMQTLDSGVNSITAVATKDVFERLLPGGRRLLPELTLARLLTLVVGVAVTCLALGVAYNVQHSGRNIVDLMPRSFNMFLGPLASLFFIGMFLPRCTARSALPAVLAGLTLSVVWSYWSELFGTDARPTITLAIAVPCTGAFATAAVLSLLVDRGGDHPGRAFTWFAVMKRPAPPPTSRTCVLESPVPPVGVER